jgi:hypothetical protein
MTITVIDHRDIVPQTKLLFGISKPVTFGRSDVAGKRDSGERNQRQMQLPMDHGSSPYCR